MNGIIASTHQVIESEESKNANFLHISKKNEDEGISVKIC